MQGTSIKFSRSIFKLKGSFVFLILMWYIIRPRFKLYFNGITMHYINIWKRPCLQFYNSTGAVDLELFSVDWHWLTDGGHTNERTLAAAAGPAGRAGAEVPRKMPIMPLHSVQSWRSNIDDMTGSLYCRMFICSKLLWWVTFAMCRVLKAVFSYFRHTV